MAERGLLRDTAWTFAAFAVMGAGGVALNMGLALAAGEAALGVFNQVYAVYVVLAQLAALGLHDAAQKHVAEHAAAPRSRAVATRSALRLVLLPGLAGAGVAVAGSVPVGWLAGSPAVGQGVAYLAPGLFLFAVNKVLMGVLAGERRLRAFSLVQIVRVLVLVGTVLSLCALGRPSAELALGFTSAEVAIVGPLVLLVRPWAGEAGGPDEARAWDRRQLAFGLRALPNGLLAESFLRVDVLMLAPFVDDASIGIYSFAAMFAEGLYQVGATVRTAVSPRLVPLLPDGPTAALAGLVRRAMALGMGAYAVAAAAVLAGFPLLAAVFDPGLVSASHAVLVVLAAGLGVYAAFLPLDQALLLAGMPGRQSAWMVGNVLVNATLNLLLIPRHGITGAAVATAIAWGASALTLNAAVWGWLGLRGGFLFRPAR